jgi:hypothetical protein
MDIPVYDHQMEKHSIAQFKDLVSEYLTGIADWRRARYQDDLRDTRNLRSADAILVFRDFFRSLPDDDIRVVMLERLWLRGEQLEVRQQAAYELGRFQFFSDTATNEGFLDQIVELAKADDVERSHFGGRQVEGDDGLDKLLRIPSADSAWE